MEVLRYEIEIRYSPNNTKNLSKVVVFARRELFFICFESKS